MSANYQYCLEKAVPAGANLYYATLFESEDVKSKIIPLFALHNEFVNCLFTSPDPGVCRLKFHWWHEELSRLSEQSPRHPVTQTLSSTLEMTPTIIEILHNHLLCIESIITDSHHLVFDDWLNYYFNGLGKFWLCVNSMDEQHPDSSLIVENGGTIFSLEILTSYRLFADKSLNFLPADLLDKYRKLDQSSETVVEYGNLFDQMLTEYRKNLGKSYQSLTNLSWKPALFNLISNRITLSTCKEIQADGNRVMEHKLYLTPIRKLCLSVMTRLGY